MKIAVINSGSSSIKFQLFAMPQGDVLAQALVEKIGQENASITFKYAQEKRVLSQPVLNHHDGLKAINLLLKECHIVEHFSSLDAIGHRVVHGGESFREVTLIDEEVIAKIQELIPLAPLHNGANLEGILVSRKKAPSVPQIAVFDTAFHASMPKESYLYALPYEMYEKHKIRRYGFHGSSHAYVMKQAAKVLGKEPKELNLITLHLGNGSSACAIQNGVSVDTSMGFTPLEGLMMGTRCGDIDPAIVLYLQRELKLSLIETDNLLNKHSGLLGVCGKIDLREILASEDERSRIALEMLVRRIKKYVGAYFAILGHLDAIVFTGGIGQNASFVREKVLGDLGLMGIELDLEANGKNAQRISKDSSRVEVLVLPTNEELEIAIECYELMKKEK